MRTIMMILLLLQFTWVYTQTKYQKDFDYYWKTINDNFAYFDVQKTGWGRVKTIYQPRVDTITTIPSFIQLLENVNDELYNGHISLNANLTSSNRLIPTGADLWVKYQRKQFIIAAVREGFRADRSGLKRGMRITYFNDKSIDNAVHDFLPKSVSVHDERMYEYAANMLLAGRHNTKRKITALWKGVERTYFPDSVNTITPDQSTLVEFKIMPSKIGYIKINNSLGNNSLIKAFDEALDSMYHTRGLILDLRETPSGGNTTVARAIMGRFIQKELPYQKHSLPNEEKTYGVRRSWVEFVSPRGKIYKQPVIILVSRWTGSMGEGIAIGFDGMKRAEVVGDKMAGLLGAIYSFTLPETKLGFSIPVEKLFHINGTPRESFIPKFLLSENYEYLPFATRMLIKKINGR